MLIFSCIIIFILLPVFAYCYEKYIIYLKMNVIKDAVDMSVLSSYNAINSEVLSGSSVDLCIEKANQNLKTLLALNLNLDSSLNPFQNSVVDGQIQIKEIAFASSASKPSVRCKLIIPVQPCFFRNIISIISGKEYFDIIFEETVEIPVNN